MNYNYKLDLKHHQQLQLNLIFRIQIDQIQLNKQKEVKFRKQGRDLHQILNQVINL